MKIREGRIPTGKGMFIYYLFRLCGGDMEKLAKQLHDEGYKWVSVRLQEGRIVWEEQQQQLLTAELVPALKKYGIEFHMWGYVWLKTWWGRVQWREELAVTLQLIARWKPRSFTVNHEEERSLGIYALDYMMGLRNGMQLAGDQIPDIPIGFSSHRFSGSKYHPLVPWEAFLRYSDFACPQVYWQQDSRPEGAVDQLLMSIEQWKVSGGLSDDFPFVPAGTVYPEGSWWPTSHQVATFCEKCKELANVVGVNFWEYYYLMQNPGLWDTLTGFEWGEDEVVDEEPVEEGTFDEGWDAALSEVELKAVELVDHIQALKDGGG